MYKKIYSLSNTNLNPLISFAWGFAEATVFFIIPDVYITFIILFNLKAGMYAFFWSIIGSIAGGSILYILYTLHFNVANILLQIPGITSTMIQHTISLFQNGEFQDYSAIPFSGIPYKAYAYSAAVNNTPFAFFILWTILARLIRLASPIIISMLIHTISVQSIRKYFQFWTLLFGIIWFIFYLWYFFTIYKVY